MSKCQIMQKVWHVESFAVLHLRVQVYAMNIIFESSNLSLSLFTEMARVIQEDGQQAEDCSSKAAFLHDYFKVLFFFSFLAF